MIFCDASEDAAVCYLHSMYGGGRTATWFVPGKAKITLTTGHSISRLELYAAVLAIEINHVTVKDLKINFDDVKFFGDSRAVLDKLTNVRNDILLTLPIV